MRDFQSDRTDLANLADIRRPKLLVQAARLGLADYRRERDLRRVLPDVLPSMPVLAHLIAAEQRLEQTRRDGALGYSPARHVETLMALMAETRGLKAD
ncbi:MAG: hypothetical protein EBU97_01025 [Rhodobacteraceae bacterium]|nr:hypothetical protein [Paracoccaceae bacterium]